MILDAKFQILSGGQAVVKSLEANNIKNVFCLAGESYLPIINALAQSNIRTITTRIESETGFAALAQGMLNGHPGVAIVTRGPGACNASITVHTASQACFPLVLCVGQVSTRLLNFDATQKLDYVSKFARYAKHIFTPRSVQDLADSINQAIYMSKSDKPGPVIIEMPIDILSDNQEIVIPQPMMMKTLYPDNVKIDQIVSLISQAQKPLIIAGELVNHENAHEELKAFALKYAIAVATSFRQQDLIAYDNPCLVGNLGLSYPKHLNEAMDEADLVINVGHRLNQESTKSFDPRLFTNKKLINIYPSETILMHPLYKADLNIFANIKPTLEELCKSNVSKYSNDGAKWVENLHQQHLNYMQMPKNISKSKVDMAKIMDDINELAPQDSIMITDAGNFATWPQIMYKFSKPHTHLGPINGAMGFGLPAAIGASVEHPDKTIIAFVGDGGFLMTGPQSLATAIHEKLKFIVILCDNSYYGTIYMHNLNHGSNNDLSLKLTNPDFTQMIKAYPNINVHKIEKSTEFKTKFQESLHYNGVSVLHLITDIDDVIAGKRLKDYKY